ncbi:response regulator transcription factor [Methylobacterium radiodurans]|uniref:DNA-binding response regulator n=1 Tax=Methylobacterium radiodurans TaxID=2202828 RepID=A0A2U8VLW3_9HYPH|nr:LuxR C-terminal-related transcriptional regulator [Methylobacterium radiodurans]AWN34655.1 DNA-binding response regulator [Methylobacterium radiodurans]
MSAAVGVLIVDEPQDLCPTVRATLEHLPELQTVQEADLEEAGPERLVALVFIDERRIADGLSRIGALRERQPRLRILAAFQALSGAELGALLAAGTDAVIARSGHPRELSAAILALAAGQACLSGPGAEPAAESGEALGLTPREAEVLRFLSAGFSNKEVARRLALSVRTVETHRLNLRRKTQTGRLKDLVSLARQLGLAPVLEEPRPARH